MASKVDSERGSRGFSSRDNLLNRSRNKAGRRLPIRYVEGDVAIGEPFELDIMLGDISAKSLRGTLVLHLSDSVMKNEYSFSLIPHKKRRINVEEIPGEQQALRLEILLQHSNRQTP